MQRILNVAVCVLVVGLIALCAFVWLSKKPAATPPPIAAKIEREPTPAEKLAKLKDEIDTKSVWPKDARFAVCSADGKTVAFMHGREIVVAKNGIEIFRDKSVNAKMPELRLSPDGSQLAAFCMWRNGIVQFDVKSGKETGFTKVREDGRRMAYNADGTKIIVDTFSTKTEIETGLPPVKINVVSTVSDDGRTVATLVTDGTRIVREGKELAKLPTLQDSMLNRDGNRILGTTVLKTVVLLDAVTGEELNTWALKSPVYRFSLGGSRMAVMEPGAEAVRLYSARTGFAMEKLPATYSFRTDEGTHTIRYTLKSFYFCGLEPTDKELIITMVSATKTELGETKDHESTIQWAPRNGFWENANIVFGALDQSFDFNRDGSLTSAASK